MSDSGRGGITFLEGLLLLFVGLKLGGVIDWSWWWVTSPFWVPVGLVLAFAACMLPIWLFLRWRGDI